MKNILFLIVLFSGSIWSQELKKHQWQHRLLVIYTSEFNNAEVQDQLRRLKLSVDDLKDRKVKVYVITKEQFWYDFSTIGEPTTGTHHITKPFEIVLIGLDGGEKFRSDKVQSVKTFTDLIDQMPMRQQEMKNKNKN